MMAMVEKKQREEVDDIEVITKAIEGGDGDN